jgi:membrane protease YdiL (CAAX protease family)
MNHLESSFTGKNQLWRYLIMFALILVISNTIGALPLLIAGLAKSTTNPDIFARLAANPNDLGALGLDPVFGLALMLFPFIAGLAAFIVLVKPLNSRTIKLTINGTGRIRWKRFIISALVWFIISAVYFFVYLKVEPSNFVINNRTISLLSLSLVSLVLIPFQATFEEVLFRGYLMQGFSTLIRNRWFPLLMTSILFALMHAFNPEVNEYGFLVMMPQYLTFGLIFGIITILDDGIEASMGAHSANNIFLCVMVTAKSSALQTPALYQQLNVFPWTEFAGLIVSGIVFILILKKLFGWKDFSVLFRKITV